MTVPTDGSPDAAARLGATALAALEGDGPAVLPTGPGDPAPTDDLLAPVDDAVAAVVTTTGSTGAPKAVVLPADALRASADATYARLGPPAGGCSRCPPTTSPGSRCCCARPAPALPPP